MAVTSPVRVWNREMDFLAKTGKYENCEFSSDTKNKDGEIEETAHFLWTGDYGQNASVFCGRFSTKRKPRARSVQFPP